jgi:hypothetical protein
MATQAVTNLITAAQQRKRWSPPAPDTRPRDLQKRRQQGPTLFPPNDLSGLPRRQFSSRLSPPQNPAAGCRYGRLELQSGSADRAEPARPDGPRFVNAEVRCMLADAPRSADLGIQSVELDGLLLPDGGL